MTHIQQTDILIIGGGINGTGIANDAAGRGLSVILCEQDDLASATSSWSSKLIHGGLRYLEQYEFKLVRESLHEREIMLNRAPHIIKPMRFVMPHNPKIRSAWLIRIGLWLYDHLSKRQSLPSSSTVNLNHDLAGDCLKPEFHQGFCYSDCSVDDARLVVLNAVAAKNNGAKILTRTQFQHANVKDGAWQAKLYDVNRKQEIQVDAKVIINAAGPWVDDVLNNKMQLNTPKMITHVKGSHFVVPKIHSDDYAYLLQNQDGRVIFVLPFLQDYSLIGTTDVPENENFDQLSISQQEIAYLCDAVNGYFNKQITANDIIWSFAGVRSLVKEDKDNPTQISRDYELKLDNSHSAPLLSVLGGKITTHRTLAEHTLAKISPYFPKMSENWTATQKLPGGDIPNNNITTFTQQLRQQHNTLPSALLERYAKSYGTLCASILEGVSDVSDLGECVGDQLFEREINYLIEHEWAQTTDDILWRRTKLGLTITEQEINKLQKIIDKTLLF